MFFPTNTDLADIWGNMDCDFLKCAIFFLGVGVQISRFPDFQISRSLVWARLGPRALGQVGGLVLVGPPMGQGRTAGFGSASANCQHSEHCQGVSEGKCFHLAVWHRHVFLEALNV